MNYLARINFLIVVSIVLILVSCKIDSAEDNNQENIQKVAESNTPQKSEHLYFVGSYGGQPSIYKFDFNTLNHKIFWYSPRCFFSYPTMGS